MDAVPLLFLCYAMKHGKDTTGNTAVIYRKNVQKFHNNVNFLFPRADLYLYRQNAKIHI